MKTAISIDDELFKKMEKLSEKLQVSRSMLYAQAFEYLLEKSETLEIIQKLNKVYGQDGTDEKIVPKSSKKKIKSIIDKW